jgi:phage-related protein
MDTPAPNISAAPNALAPLTAALDALSNAVRGVVPELTAVCTAFKPLAPAIDTFAGSMGNMVPQLSGVSAALGNVGQQFFGITSSMSTSFSTLFSGFNKGLQGVGQAATGNFSSAISSVSGAVGGMLSGLTGLASGIGGLLGGVVSLGQAMAGLVGLANPQVLQIFNNALDDMQAVMGQALAPILEVVTQVIRMAADSLASFLPQIGAVIANMMSAFLPAVKTVFDIFGEIGNMFARVFAAVAPAVEAIGMAFTVVYEALRPIEELIIQLLGGILIQAMTLLAEVVQFVTPYIVTFARVLKDAFEWMSNAVKELLAGFGVKLPELVAPNKGTADGAAAKGKTIGSVDDVISKAMQSAFGMGKAAEPSERTASATEGIRQAAQQIYEKMREMLTRLSSLGKEISNAIKEWLLRKIDEIFNIGKYAWGAVLSESKGPGINNSKQSLFGDDTWLGRRGDAAVGYVADFGGFLDQHVLGNKPKGAT